ncbi:fumarylacetoacetate hydrolase family protein [Nocardioides sp. AN3]
MNGEIPGVEMLAAVLDDAICSASAVPQLTASRDLDLGTAYRIQAAGIRLRVDRGESVVGAKLGFTSKAKAEQMGVSDVIAGVLTSGMHLDDGGTVDLARLIHPRIEPEIAFRLSRAIDPLDPLENVWSAVDAVAPAMEVIDSRYRDFSFSLADVVADNTSAAGYVVGGWLDPAGVELNDLGVTLEVDGDVVETGTTAAILGHPVRAVAAIARMARSFGLALPAGSTILAGAATAAVSLPRSSGAVVTATVSGLGRVGVVVGGGDPRG